MILLFDAGNTNTKICLANDEGLGESYTLPTRPANTADDWGLKIEAILRREGVDPADVEAVRHRLGGAVPGPAYRVHGATLFGVRAALCRARSGHRPGEPVRPARAGGARTSWWAACPRG